ncbi:ABC transporter substrate-binding protein [Phaeovulum sp.]|uniref:ABC transporter substrate-binding protein n=1 Tax=Phaeovulum sp. TaxID=2934796 RepID=UPI003561E8FC
MIKRLAAALAILVLAGPATAEELKFAVDGPITGAAAAYVFGADSGLFEAEGLDLDVRATRSALDAVSRIALGSYPFGVVDMPTFAEYIIMNPGSRVISLMVIHDRPAFTVVALKSSGIAAVTDLPGHVVGQDSDSFAKYRMQNIANSNSFDMSDLTFKNVAPTELAAALAAGEVDAVTGFSYEILPELAKLGVATDDLVIMPMADNGLVLYGQVLVINSDYLAKSSGVATRLTAAVLKAWKATIADPEAAVAAVIARNAELDPALEAERLRMIIAENVLTPYVLENGFATPSQARQEWNVAQLQDNPAFINSEERDTFFNMNFLPSAKDRAMQ